MALAGRAAVNLLRLCRLLERCNAGLDCERRFVTVDPLVMVVCCQVVE
jgi:hypothetical protein